ncbi:MAG: hypothetical protein JW954_00270 [Dehalococcoidaceae bacterium]|nr:hypothetical protein [Dehalococcoidaceae bacterium]
MAHVKKRYVLLGVILVLIITAYFVAGYFLGNLPIASNMLGTNKPRDLGAQISIENAYSGLKSLGHPLTLDELGSIAQDPDSFRPVKTSITDDEIASLLSLADLPIKLVQVRCGPGGRAEISGMLNVKEMQQLLSRLGVPNDAIATAMDYLSNIDWTTFYIDGALDIKNNQVSLDIDKIELGRISLPGGLKDQITDNIGSIENYVEDALGDMGYNIRSLSFSEGKAALDLDRPLDSMEPWIGFIQ